MKTDRQLRDRIIGLMSTATGKRLALVARCAEAIIGNGRKCKVNSVQLVGDIVEPIRINETANSRVATLRICTRERSYKDPERTFDSYHTIKAWGHHADAAEGAQVGDKAVVLGQLRYNTFETDSGKKTVAEVNAQNLAIIQTGGPTNGAGAGF